MTKFDIDLNDAIACTPAWKYLGNNSLSQYESLLFPEENLMEDWEFSGLKVTSKEEVFEIECDKEAGKSKRGYPPNSGYNVPFFWYSCGFQDYIIYMAIDLFLFCEYSYE